MSSLQYAFSEELNEVVSVDEAYDLFWQGKLTDKRRFSCPGNNCSAQVTCACMDTKELELKQSPNFRVYSEHDPNCEYLSFLERDEYSTSSRKGTDTSEQNCAEFILQRKQKPLEVKGTRLPREKGSGIRKVTDGYEAYSARPKYYSIRPIVDRFFSFHEDGTLSERYIKVNGEVTTYKHLFKGIFNQHLESLDDRYFIYWGLAFINRTQKKDSFQVRFSNHFIHEDLEIRPSIFIKDSVLDKYNNNRLRQYLNQENVKGNVHLFAFVYGVPVLVKRADATYINFEVTDLDYIDFKSKSYFDKLTRKFS